MLVNATNFVIAMIAHSSCAQMDDRDATVFTCDMLLEVMQKPVKINETFLQAKEDEIAPITKKDLQAFTFETYDLLGAMKQTREINSSDMPSTNKQFGCHAIANMLVILEYLSRLTQWNYDNAEYMVSEDSNKDANAKRLKRWSYCTLWNINKFILEQMNTLNQWRKDLSAEEAHLLNSFVNSNTFADMALNCLKANDIYKKFNTYPQPNASLSLESINNAFLDNFNEAHFVIPVKEKKNEDNSIHGNNVKVDANKGDQPLSFDKFINQLRTNCQHRMEFLNVLRNDHQFKFVDDGESLSVYSFDVEAAFKHAIELIENNKIPFAKSVDSFCHMLATLNGIFFVVDKLRFENIFNRDDVDRKHLAGINKFLEENPIKENSTDDQRKKVNDNIQEKKVCESNIVQNKYTKDDIFESVCKIHNLSISIENFVTKHMQIADQPDEYYAKLINLLNEKVLLSVSHLKDNDAYSQFIKATSQTPTRLEVEEPQNEVKNREQEHKRSNEDISQNLRKPEGTGAANSRRNSFTFGTQNSERTARDAPAWRRGSLDGASQQTPPDFQRANRNKKTAIAPTGKECAAITAENLLKDLSAAKEKIAAHRFGAAQKDRLTTLKEELGSDLKYDAENSILKKMHASLEASLGKLPAGEREIDEI
ncbi:hypothetical protein ENBRE01_2730, partial [Enteropsectra breve]